MRVRTGVPWPASSTVSWVSGRTDRAVVAVAWAVFRAVGSNPTARGPVLSWFCWPGSANQSSARAGSPGQHMLEEAMEETLRREPHRSSLAARVSIAEGDEAAVILEDALG